MSYLRISIREDKGLKNLVKKLDAAGPKAAHIVAVQIEKDTQDFVPALTMSLSNRAQVVENRIIYPGPYARCLYEGKVMVDSKTGKGPMRIKGKDGTEIIRFRKGATLKPTDRPLDIKQSVHKNAQSHWFEASKAQNLEKWERVAGKAIVHELGE